MQESPIFTRTHQLTSWLLQVTRRFPRNQRFALARRLEEQVFDLDDALVAASRDRRRTGEHLLRADIHLSRLRRGLLLCHELGLLSDGQLRHAAGLLAEVGKLLGGWRKKVEGES